MHTHSYNEVFFILEGRHTIRLEDSMLHLQAGDIAIVPAGITHILQDNNKEIKTGKQVLAFCFICNQRNVRSTQNLYEYFNQLLGYTKPFVLRNEPELCEEAKKILTPVEISASPVNHKLMLRMMQLVSLLSSIIDKGAKEDITPPENKDMLHDVQRNFRLEEIIGAQYTEPIDAKYVADKLYISQRQLERIMKKRYGMTLRQTLNDRRLTTAAELLSSTDIPIEEIESKMGFASKVGFSREFVKKYGMTPLQFRKRKIRL